LAVREALGEFRITEDKRVFEAWCATHGFPAARGIAEFGDGRLLTLRTGSERLPEADLFSKPVDKYGGEGARRWRYLGNDRWASDAGEALDGNSLLAALTEQSRGGSVLLQRCIVNHPAAAALSSGALCTVRIVTARLPGALPELMRAAFRMPTGGSSTDNYSQGGIVAAVDLESGHLGTAVRSHPQLVAIDIERHPDTGTAFRGYQLPDWEAARGLVLRAHEQMRDIACVGWDVALTPSGPVLIEANFAPGVTTLQTPFDTPLGDTPYMRYMDAHLRRSFSRAR
jgi:hypothetical protein